MDHTALAKMYIDAVKDDSIEVSTLIKVPELLTCGDWKKVEILGVLDYVSDRTKIVYNGVLVKYNGGLYYMKKKLSDALGEIDKRFRNVKKSIRVLS